MFLNTDFLKNKVVPFRNLQDNAPAHTAEKNDGFFFKRMPSHTWKTGPLYASIPIRKQEILKYKGYPTKY